MTLKEIAEIAGVSIKTASRALNNYPDIKKETKELILSIAKEHHYLPNVAAKSLRQNRSYAIGLVVPDLTNVFFGEVGVAIHNYFKKHGYSTLISFSEGKRTTEIESLDSLIAKQVDGIILATVGSTGDYLRTFLQEKKIPLVVIDNEVNGLRTNIVLHDNQYHAYLLTKHLYDQGCRNIALISGPLSETSGLRRYEGFLKAIDELGLHLNPDHIVYGDWTIQGGKIATEKLIAKSKGEIDGILAANSLMAFGLYAVLHEHGFHIPSDIAVASFDDLEIVEALDPPLTTLTKVDSTIGELAAKRLYTMIRNPEDKELREILVKGELKIRASTVR